MNKVYPTSKQWAMTSTEVADRIATICLEAIKPGTNREALLTELHQLEVIQSRRHNQIMEAACY